MKKIAWIVFALLAIGLYSWYSNSSNTEHFASFTQLPHFNEGKAIPADNQSIYTLKDLNDAIVNIADNSNKAVVTILTSQTVTAQANPLDLFFGNRNPQQREFTRQGLGSGVIVSKEGYILTNNHVVQDADSIRVRLIDDQDYAVKLVGRDPQTDIAVLQLEDKSIDFSYLSIGDSDALRIGEFVIAIGSPLDDDLAHTVTMGIVSGKGRPAGPTVIQDQQGRQVQIPSLAEYIQTDAAINPGNSGGALIDMNGRLVGINSAIATRTGGFQGIGFAIPVNLARQVMESLIENGRVVRGFLGIIPQEITPNMAKALGLERRGGVLIGTVSEDTPAEEYGLKEGDVILRMNGQRIRNEASFRVMIASLLPGQKVVFDLLREGDEKTVEVIIAEREDDLSEMVNQGLNNDNSSNDNRIINWENLGFRAQNLDDESRERFNVQEGVQGILVTAVSRNSKTAEVLAPGDVITEFNRQPISNLNDFETALEDASKNGKEVLLIRYVRGNNALFGALEIK